MHPLIVPPCSQWGSPTSEKRAICLHGLTSHSQVWCRVGEQLAERGFFVTAPDMIGHGGRDISHTTSFTVQDYALDILPLLDLAQPYTVVIGHSFGGPVALALVPYLLASGASRVHIVLVEPALELSANNLQKMKIESIDEVTSVRTVTQYMQENPLWTRRDAIVKYFGASTCTPVTVASVCDANNPWSFTSLFPLPSTRVSTTILAADQLNQPYFTPSEMKNINNARSDIRTIVIPGASHAIPREFPHAVVDAVVQDGSTTHEFRDALGIQFCSRETDRNDLYFSAGSFAPEPSAMVRA